MNRPFARPRWSGVDHAHQQGHRRHGEHRAADAADRAEQKELDVALGKAGDGRRPGHEEDPEHEDLALAPSVDEPPAAQRRHKPHQCERRDDGCRCRVPYPEVAGKDGERGCDDSEPDGDGKGDGGEDRNLAGHVCKGIRRSPHSLSWCHSGKRHYVPRPMTSQMIGRNRRPLSASPATSRIQHRSRVGSQRPASSRAGPRRRWPVGGAGWVEPTLCLWVEPTLCLWVEPTLCLWVEPTLCLWVEPTLSHE